MVDVCDKFGKRIVKSLQDGAAQETFHSAVELGCGMFWSLDSHTLTALKKLNIDPAQSKQNNFKSFSF